MVDGLALEQDHPELAVRLLALGLRALPLDADQSLLLKGHFSSPGVHAWGIEGDEFHKPPSGGSGITALASPSPERIGESPMNGAQRINTTLPTQA